MPPSLLEGSFPSLLEQKVRTLGIKPTACECPRVYSGDHYLLSRAEPVWARLLHMIWLTLLESGNQHTTYVF